MDNTQEVKPVVSEKSEDAKVDAPASTQATQPASSGAQYGDEEEEEKKQIHLVGEKLKSGEEGETLIYIKKAKIYWFRDGKWKERGDGYCKFLRSKDNKIWFIQR